jgi:hypothetical protein
LEGSLSEVLKDKRSSSSWFSAFDIREFKNKNKSMNNNIGHGWGPFVDSIDDKISPPWSKRRCLS